MTESGLLGIQIGAQGAALVSASAVTQTGVAGSVDLFSTQAFGKAAYTGSMDSLDAGKGSFRKNLEEMTSALGDGAGALPPSWTPATGATIRLPDGVAAEESQAKQNPGVSAAKLNGGLAVEKEVVAVPMEDVPASERSLPSSTPTKLDNPVNPDPTPLPPLDGAEQSVPVRSFSPAQGVPGAPGRGVPRVPSSPPTVGATTSQVMTASSAVRVAPSRTATRMHATLEEKEGTASAVPASTVAPELAALPTTAATTDPTSTSALPALSPVSPAVASASPEKAAPLIPTTAAADMPELARTGGLLKPVAGSDKRGTPRGNHEGWNGGALPAASATSLQSVAANPEGVSQFTGASAPIDAASVASSAPASSDGRNDPAQVTTDRAGRVSTPGMTSAVAVTPRRASAIASSPLAGHVPIETRAGATSAVSPALGDATVSLADFVPARASNGQEPAVGFVQAFNLQPRPMQVVVQPAVPVTSAARAHGAPGGANHAVMTSVDAGLGVEGKDAKENDEASTGKDRLSSIDIMRSDVALQSPAVAVHGDTQAVAAPSTAMALHAPAALAPPAHGESVSTSAPGSPSAIATSLLQQAGGADHHDLMDGFGSAHPATLRSTPNLLEVGVASGSHGWLKVRAELDGAGGVSASVITSTPNALQMMHKELPALSAYLTNQAVGVSSLVVNPGASAGAAAGNWNHDSAMNLGAGPGGGGPAREQAHTPTSTTSWATEESSGGRPGVRPSTVEDVGLNTLSAAQREASEPGGWLSVRA